jgi:hypothetical protein
MSRDNYNRWVGKDGSPPRLELHEVATQLAAAFTFFDQQGYFQRSFGNHCVDAGEVAGLKGCDLRQALYLDTGIKITGSVKSFTEGAADDVAGRQASALPRVSRTCEPEASDLAPARGESLGQPHLGSGSSTPRSTRRPRAAQG